MRRALGLGTAPSPRSQPAQSTPAHNGIHRPPRHFAKEGEVPVTLINRVEATGTNQLEAARQTIRSLASERDASERSLAEAQAAIQQLRTQLAHERLARDEAASRAEAERLALEQTLQTVRDELVAERAVRQQTQNGFGEATQGRQEDETRYGVTINSSAQEPPHARRRGRPRKQPQQLDNTASTVGPMVDANPEATDRACLTVSESLGRSVRKDGPDQADLQQPKQPRRRGRPPKVQQPEPEYVEWWVPGWKERAV